MKLSYEEFKDKMVNELQDHMSDKYLDATVEVKKTNKVNREVDGLIMHNIPGMEMESPTIYINDLYKEYEETEDFQQVISNAGKTMEGAIKTFDQDVKEHLVDFSKVPERIFVSLVNAEQNREMLKTVPHREFEDLAIVYRWSVNEGPEGLYTNLITNELADRIGLTEPKMYELGMENTQKLYPLVVKNMNEIVSEMVFGDDMPSEMREEFDGILDDTPDDKSMFVMTNEAKIFGAAAMLFEDKLHELAEKFGTDLYILPSSIHECIAVSANMGDPESLAEMVYEVNMNEVDISERLSNQVYQYNKDERTLRLATDTPYKSIGDDNIRSNMIQDNHNSR